MSYINSIGFYLPENKLTNEDINKSHPEWSAHKISQKTGIDVRYITDDEELSSDLAVKAANKLFENRNIDRNSIDYIILCTQSPDYLLPTTACILQDRLSLSENIGATDINLGCSGFIYGIGLAHGLIETKQVENVLFLTAETYSKFIHPDDKSNKTIFGDAAAATLISKECRSDINFKVGNFVYKTDGTGYDKLIMRNSGMRRENIEDQGLYMDGKEIFRFTSLKVPILIDECLEVNKMKKDDIDIYIFHQANRFMLQTIGKRAKIDQDKLFLDLSCGNTVSSTIPIAIKNAQEKGLLQKNGKILIAGFGVGLSMGATILTID
ncbi:MAG: 3-oxoacyl-ACP synthase [Balneola sp.]|nr:3-oxoacyl-ACP synthase [Balneola sp.]|tara:strand:- start:22934 stop:23905 length:972 start_codon:yes stop_codon:yes gene_type:complete